jgi:hypothetical protein
MHFGDFLTKAKVRIDFAVCRYGFVFHPSQEFDFERFDLANGTSQQFPCPNDGTAGLGCGMLSQGSGQMSDVANLIRKFPALFSDQLGTVKGLTCHLEVTDTIPVRSRRIHAPPAPTSVARDRPRSDE